MGSLMTDEIRNLGARKMDQQLMLQRNIGQENTVSGLGGDLPFQLGWFNHVAQRPLQESWLTLSHLAKRKGGIIRPFMRDAVLLLPRIPALSMVTYQDITE